MNFSRLNIMLMVYECFPSQMMYCGHVLQNLNNFPNFENRMLPKTEFMIFKKHNFGNLNLFTQKVLLAWSPGPFVECILATDKIAAMFKLQTVNLLKVSETFCF